MSFDFYQKALEAEMEIFKAAFAHRNNLFPAKTKITEPRDVDRDKIRKIAKMMDGMDIHTRRKMIELTEE